MTRRLRAFTFRLVRTDETYIATFYAKDEAAARAMANAWAKPRGSIVEELAGELPAGGNLLRATR